MENVLPVGLGFISLIVSTKSQVYIHITRAVKDWAFNANNDTKQTSGKQLRWLWMTFSIRLYDNMCLVWSQIAVEACFAESGFFDLILLIILT